MYNYIHIPKTGGNWVNNYVGPQNTAMALHGHKAHIHDYNNVVFTLRHPVDKFISGACFLHNIRFKHVKRDTNEILRFYQEPWSEVMPFAKVILQPLSVNFGTLNEYKTNEHRVGAVIDFDCLTKGYTNLLNLERPVPEPSNVTKPYSKTIDSDLQKWIESYYSEDFELYNYIRSRPYYITAS